MSEHLQATFTLPPEVLEIVASRAAELVHVEETNGYLTAKSAASLLDCDPKRIYKLVRQGRLRQFKEGGRSLFLRADVLYLVENPS